MPEDAPRSDPRPDPRSDPPERPPAGPPSPSVAFFLVNLGRRAREQVEAALNEHGIAYPQLSALGHLRRAPGLSYSELARRAGVTVQSMQSTVIALERKGFVERGPRTTQGRRAELTVTDAGMRVLAAGESAVRAVDEQLLSGFSRTERDQLERGLGRLFRQRA